MLFLIDYTSLTVYEGRCQVPGALVGGVHDE